MHTGTIIARKYTTLVSEVVISNNSDFFSAELCLRIQYYGFKFIEVPVNYYQRNEVSKALPLHKIPKLIFNFLTFWLQFVEIW